MTAPPQLPLGTQVVTREELAAPDGTTVARGARGRVVSMANGNYLVELPDGHEIQVSRHQVSVRRAYQRDVVLRGAALKGTDDSSRVDDATLVRDRTILAVVVGSRAFGLATAGSDTDTRAVFVAPTKDFWSLVKPPRHIEGPDPEWFSWEVERFCELALKANPNLLEVLHSPLVVRSTALGAELLDLRRAFLSQLMYQTYSGYVLSQFTKVESDIRQRGAPKWKHVMHLLRLLISARGLLATGQLSVDVGAHRDRLLAVREGEESWEVVERWRLDLHRDLDAALLATPLPEYPDVGGVDRWLRSVRESSARADLT